MILDFIKIRDTIKLIDVQAIISIHQIEINLICKKNVSKCSAVGFITNNLEGKLVPVFNIKEYSGR